MCQLIRSRGGLNLIVTHRRRAGLDQLLTTHGLADHFTDIISHDDRYPRKPEPDAFSTLIERHRLPRGETLAVGDRDIDILAAHAAGLAAAHFGANPITTTPDVVLPDFGTLRRLIETGWTPQDCSARRQRTSRFPQGELARAGVLGSEHPDLAVQLSDEPSDRHLGGRGVRQAPCDQACVDLRTGRT